MDLEEIFSRQKTVFMTSDQEFYIKNPEFWVMVECPGSRIKVHNINYFTSYYNDACSYSLYR